MGKYVRLRNRTKENDIKYGGFLSYRHLRIIGWVCLVLAQMATMFKITMNMNPTTVGMFTNAYNVFSAFAGPAVPLFLIANFAVIAQQKGNWKGLLLRYGGLALIMYVAANLIIIHFAHGFVHALNPNADLYSSTLLFGGLLASAGSQGYALNIFIDLFLCTLAFFFLNYKPVKFFQGKKIILFRLLVLLPLAYEVAGILVKFYISLGAFVIPSFALFALPSKPPLIFLAMFIIFVIMKLGEVRRMKKNQSSQEDLSNYLDTNAHSLLTSIYMSIVFLVCVILDVILLILLGVSAFKYLGGTTDTLDEYFPVGLQVAYAAGFGASVPLLFCIPVVLLFNYKKTHKNSKIDSLVPIAGIALILVVYVEGLFQVITNNISYFMYKISNVIPGGGGEETPPAEQALYAIKEIVRSIRNK